MEFISALFGFMGSFSVCALVIWLTHSSGKRAVEREREERRLRELEREGRR